MLSMLQFSLLRLFFPLQASLIVILAGFLEGKEIKTHGQFIIWHGNPGKLHKLHNGNLPHIVLSCAIKQAAPLFCWWKGKQKFSPNQIRNSVLPFWNLNIGPNCWKNPFLKKKKCWTIHVHPLLHHLVGFIDRVWVIGFLNACDLSLIFQQMWSPGCTREIAVFHTGLHPVFSVASQAPLLEGCGTYGPLPELLPASGLPVPHGSLSFTVHLGDPPFRVTSLQDAYPESHQEVFSDFGIC